MKTNTVLRIFLITLVSVFLFHQIYSSVYKPVTTESTYFFEAVDGLKITGTKPKAHCIFPLTME